MYRCMSEREILKTNYTLTPLIRTPEIRTFLSTGHLQPHVVMQNYLFLRIIRYYGIVFLHMANVMASKMHCF